ncbi:hypothetical protein C1Y40_04935 [Mycobacterium talmoniae]|uniref:Uncharacterized protein n=1 Tax=Mycobacterium talmoniae TaxID=1858794 RepID=A0A2S8BE25_9MYCO|nr:hypothetical protein C1Y40_04935 [Mycobacterium talmoniae]
MSMVVVACLTVGGLLGGVGLFELQARLERWDQQRHIND